MHLVFVSTMAGSPWGGSEELWTHTAREALRRGHSVATVSRRWPSIPTEIASLAEAGALLYFWDPPQRPWSSARRVLRSGPRPLPVPLDADVVLVSQGGTKDASRNPALRRLGSDLTSQRIPFLVLCHSVTDIPVSDEVRNQVSTFLSLATEVGFLTPSLQAVSERVVGLTLDRPFRFANPLKNYEYIEWPGVADETLRMASVGTMDLSVKGQGDLLELLAAKTWRTRDWLLTLAGSGPDLGEITSMVQAHPASMKITIAGHVSNIRNLWAKNQLLVMPSRVEGLPSTLLEAMLAGRPAVVTAVGAMPEVVQDRQSGWIADTSAPGDLAAPMEAMWEERRRLRSAGAQARKRALEFAVERPESALLDRILLWAGRQSGS